MRCARLVSLLIVASSMVACTAPSNVQAEKISGTVSSLPVPRGWTEPEPMQTVCMEPNLDCQDPNARRIFTTESNVDQACAEFIGWVKNNAVFEVPRAIVGTAEKEPAVQDCKTELGLYARFSVTARAPDDAAGNAKWLLRVTPYGKGFTAAVVLGAPPRDPWRS